MGVEVFHFAMSPRVKLQIPEDLTTEEVIKSLEATVESLKKGGREPNLSAMLSSENDAMSHLVRFMDESFEIMTESLEKEIKKVLTPK